MKLTCVIIDDEPLAIELIKQYASKFPALEVKQIFLNAISGAEYLRNGKTDLLFLDIQMPDITGLQLLRSLKNPPMVIFTTAYSQYALDAFELDVLDYLLKPIEFDRFEKAVNKAIQYFNFKNGETGTAPEYIYVRSDYRMIKVELDKVEYIESFDDYVKVYLSDKSSVMTLMSLKKIQDKLSADKFLRVHRSYVVSLAKVKTIVNRKIQLSYTEIPVGDTYITRLNELIK
jgi:two-component system, LytTR family, response regulator